MIFMLLIPVGSGLFLPLLGGIATGRKRLFR